MAAEIAVETKKTAQKNVERKREKHSFCSIEENDQSPSDYFGQSGANLIKLSSLLFMPWAYKLECLSPASLYRQTQMEYAACTSLKCRLLV